MQSTRQVASLGTYADGHPAVQACSVPEQIPAFPPSLELGRAIRRRRLARGFGEGKEAARELGWSPSTFSRLENGHRGIYPRDVRSLAALLEVDPDWFSAPGAAPADQWSREEIINLRALIEEQSRNVQALIDLVSALVGAPGGSPLPSPQNWIDLHLRPPRTEESQQEEAG